MTAHQEAAAQGGDVADEEWPTEHWSEPVPPEPRRPDRIQRVSIQRVAAVALMLAAGTRVFDVALMGIVTNDSLGYLRRSEAPLAGGIVSQGYRQAAYPVFVMLSNMAGDVLGWDHIFGVALAQRTILLVGIAIVIWAMRWWSLPIVVVLTSSTVVVHSNLLLPEGLLIPLCTIIGGLAAAVVFQRAVTPSMARVTLVAFGALVVLAASVKLQYAVLAAVLAAAAWMLQRDGVARRQFAMVTVGVVVGSVAVLALVQSFENKSELGVFEPVSERARAEWYGAWQSVFVLDSDNHSDPVLAEFWDGGSLYTFMHGIEATVDDYPTRAAMFRKRVDEMFGAAGTTVRAQQFRAFVGALGMGRMDDIGTITDQVLDSGSDPETAVSFNLAYRRGGLQEIVEGYNDGYSPGVATLGPLMGPPGNIAAEHRQLQRWIAWLSIFLMLLSLVISGRHRLICGAILIAIVFYSGALSLGYIDNARYLLGPYTLCMTGGVLALRALARGRPGLTMRRGN